MPTDHLFTDEANRLGLRALFNVMALCDHPSLPAGVATRVVERALSEMIARVETHLALLADAQTSRVRPKPARRPRRTPATA